VSLVVRDLTLPLGELTLDVTFELSGGTTALYGPSGSGKTTLLELIAGLRRPASGRIELNGRVVFDRNVFVPPRLRRVGYVPQDDALFPHLSVAQNVFYGASERRHEVLDVLELGPLLERSVRRLSGGERKRVALARALLSNPEVLLLDEPLAGVDLALRDRVLEYLVRVLREVRVPALYVTHHLDEVRALCDDMVVLERGTVKAKGMGAAGMGPAAPEER
jgi:molybdate transport system ATP-binding protein